MALKCLYPAGYIEIIKNESAENGVKYTLVLSVIRAESGFDANAVSRAGAVGLMQLMPSTAEHLCAEIKLEYDYDKLFDPEFNIVLGVYYLKYLLKKFPKSDALAAYNAGEGNVRKWKNENLTEYPFKETRDYVKKILGAEKVYVRFSHIL